MKKCKLTGVVVVSAVLLTASCATRHYQMTGIDRTRVLVDQRYDQQPDAEAARFLAPYTHTVDSIMSPIVGETTHYMSARRPESDLSNLLSDILVWSGEQRGDHPDFGLYNMGGIRASLPEGKVTYGDLVDVAPFDNKLCLLTLTGEKTLQLFREIASVGGEGVSMVWNWSSRRTESWSRPVSTARRSIPPSHIVWPRLTIWHKATTDWRLSFRRRMSCHRTWRKITYAILSVITLKR